MNRSLPQRRVQCLVMIGVVLTISSCTSHVRAAPQNSRPLPNPGPSFNYRPVPATAAFQMTEGSPIRKLATDLVLGKTRGHLTGTVLVFPRLRVTAACVGSVILVLHDVRVAGSGTDVSVYPSAAFALGSGGLPTAPDRDGGTLLDNQPKGSVFTASTPLLRIDVTDLIKSWLDGYFPSQGAAVPPGTAEILTVRSPGSTDTGFDVRAAGTASGSLAPTLNVADIC